MLLQAQLLSSQKQDLEKQLACSKDMETDLKSRLSSSNIELHEAQLANQASEVKLRSTQASLDSVQDEVLRVAERAAHAESQVESLEDSKQAMSKKKAELESAMAALKETCSDLGSQVSHQAT